MKRKKRLKKGIESIKKQIEIHEENKKEAERLGREELVNYYASEIESKERDKEKKEKLLEKEVVLPPDICPTLK